MDDAIDGVCLSRAGREALPAGTAARFAALLVLSVLVFVAILRRRQRKKKALNSDPTIVGASSIPPTPQTAETPPPTPPNFDDTAAASTTATASTIAATSTPVATQSLPPKPQTECTPEGEHTITFPDGSTYSGQICGGLPHGRGIMLWPSTGERYEGEFRNGLQDGQGTLASPDGSLYFGGWAGGRLHGPGVYKPPPHPVTATAVAVTVSEQESALPPPPSTKVGKKSKLTPISVLFREYVDGRLQLEVPLRAQELDPHRRSQAKRAQKAMAAVAASAVPTAASPATAGGGGVSAGRPLAPGEVVFKGHRSYDLMRQLQLGIMYSLAQAGLSSRPSPSGGSAGSVSNDTRDAAGHHETFQNDALTPKDFTIEEVQYFPSGTGVFEGTLPGFKWKNYAPKAFHRLRQLFGIDPADYLMSLTGGPALRELPSPGQSGAIFFLSEDDRFLIKSMRKDEMHALLSIALRKYTEHVERTQGQTLLVRFFGIHRVSPTLGRNARFVVMGNVLPSEVRMHRKFDVKGSTYKRTVGKVRRSTEPGITLKDLDVDVQFELPSAVQRDALIAQLAKDADFLEQLGVIDYSLLIGAHFVKWGERGEWYPPFTDWPGVGSDDSNGVDGVGGDDIRRRVVEEEEDGGDGDENGTQGDERMLKSNNRSQGGGLNNKNNHNVLSVRKPSRQLSLVDGDVLAESLTGLALQEEDGDEEIGVAAAGASDSRNKTKADNLPKTAAQVISQANSMRELARRSAAAALIADRQDGSRTSIITTTSLTAVDEGAHGCSSSDTYVAPPLQQKQVVADGVASKPSPPPPVNTNNNNLSKSPPPTSTTAGRSSGWEVHATAIRRTASGTLQREPVVLYFGIIDFLQKYSAKKFFEHAWKVALHGSAVSVADPKFYRKRFMEQMNRIFVADVSSNE